MTTFLWVFFFLLILCLPPPLRLRAPHSLKIKAVWLIVILQPLRQREKSGLSALRPSHEMPLFIAPLQINLKEQSFDIFFLLFEWHSTGKRKKLPTELPLPTRFGRGNSEGCQIREKACGY
jgi:hypothetical protein